MLLFTKYSKYSVSNAQSFVNCLGKSPFSYLSDLRIEVFNLLAVFFYLLFFNPGSKYPGTAIMISDEKIFTPSPPPIAIVGMACRFPGDATNPSKLWDLCATGRNGYSLIPNDRFDVRSLYDVNKEAIGKVSKFLDRTVGYLKAVLICIQNHVLGGYFLHEDIARFDAAFFNLPADVASVSISLKEVSVSIPLTCTRPQILK